MYMEQWENWDNYGKIVFCTTCSVVKEEAGAGVLRPGTYTEEKTEQGTQQRLTWPVSLLSSAVRQLSDRNLSPHVSFSASRLEVLLSTAQ